MEIDKRSDYKMDTISKSDEVPTKRELFGYIIELREKCNKLELEIKYLKNLNKSSNNCNIKDISKHTPRQSFTSWLNTLKILIQRSHLELLFQYGYFHGNSLILEELIQPDDPFTCVGCKNSYFLIWDNDEWFIITDSYIDTIISEIGKYLVKLLVIWQKENVHRISNESFSTYFFENIQKTIGGKYSRTQIILNVKKTILKILKSYT